MNTGNGGGAPGAGGVWLGGIRVGAARLGSWAPFVVGLPGSLKGPSAYNLTPAQKIKLTPSWGTSLTDIKAHRDHGPRQRSHGHRQVRSSPLQSSSPRGLAVASLLEKLTRLCQAELTGVQWAAWGLS